MFVPLLRRYAALIKRSFQGVEELQRFDEVPNEDGKRAESLAQ